MGIALPSLAGKLLTISELLALANQTGIAAATAWMFIDYETWGRVDAVYAAGLADGSAFGPFDDSNGETVETTYLDVMARFGVNNVDALDFEPFYRGFWGE